MLYSIVTNFAISGEIQDIKPFGKGLINSSFLVTTSNSSKYLLQKINHAIFTDVAGLSQNIERVTNHIRSKLVANNVQNIEKKVLSIVYTSSNELYYADGEAYWRMFHFIEGSETYDKIETPQQAIATGKAFAEFQQLLSDLNTPPLNEVLKGFHNTPMRIDTFLETLKNDVAHRQQSVQHEINFLLERKDEMKQIVEQGKKGELPLRVVHQDAKLNNILFDKQTNEILCVIDLDTTMPGYVCYDFGDAMRTGACTAKEDEMDLSKVDFDFEVFQNFAKGYMSVAKHFLTNNEIQSLAFGAKLLTYEQAVRFLNDYLQGDTYYKTEYPEHNLVRTRTQIKLLQKMELRYQEMQDFIFSFI